MDTQEARIFIAIIITVVVLVIIIGYFAVSVIRQQRRNLELQKANALAEISAMEKERARIAADLHDDLGPVLSVVKFRVDSVETENKEEKEELTKASQQLDELITRMREVANNLMPSALIRKGLIGAVEEFTNNAADGSGIDISFTTPASITMGEDKSINIYRVIQEVVHNCLKHAQARKMDIVFEERNGLLKIICRDNGKGFDFSKLSNESTGIGLRSIKNRTEIMGGRMTVESKPGLGTAFLFEIPVK
jgi:two-component system, NarL family, sensor kinase